MRTFITLYDILMQGCDAVTDVGLQWLAAGCKLLEELNLSGCKKITDAGLRSIGDSCNLISSSNAFYLRLKIF